MRDLKETAVKTRDFVRRLQRSDERTKKHFVYGISAAAMLLIFVLWLAYLNMTLPQAAPVASVSTSTAGTEATSAPAMSGGTSFLGTFGRGFDLVWGDIGRSIGKIGDTVGGAWQGFQKQIQRTNTMELNASSTNQ